MSEIDAALTALAKACQEKVTGLTYLTAWSAASPRVRPETVSSTATEPIAKKIAELRFLYDNGGMFVFAMQLLAMDPLPDQVVRAALRDLQMATTISLVRWDSLGEAAKQALIDDRDAFMNDMDIVEFHQKAWPRMCCVVGRTKRIEGGVETDITIGGTAFLIGPDLVMTNDHVIAPLLDGGGTAHPGTHEDFAVFFDHFEKQKVSNHRLDYSGALRVLPAEDWLVARSPENGPGRDVNACLDFAVIRLKDRMGLSAANQRYGARRGWMKVPTPGEAINLTTADRVAIPQHPGGQGLVIDIGRVKGTPVGAPSRVLYLVNTEKGSSGSPVLGTGGKLVALHEGSKEEGQGGRDAAAPNQGIRIATFNGALAPLLPAAMAPLPADLEERWCVRGAGSERRPLIGRRVFIEWALAARKAVTAQERRDAPPLCLVHGSSRSGKSFSADILAALVENRGDHLVVFRSSSKEGASGPARAYALPERPDRLLQALAEEVGLAIDSLPKAPPELDQLETNLGKGAVNDRKLNAWSSEDLPRWLEAQLRTAFESKPDARLWTVFDIAPGAPFGPLIRDFICKWTAPVEDDAHPFAKCCWVFIDYKPDFGVQMKDDPLAPAEDVTVDDLLRFIDAAYGAMGGDQPGEVPELMKAALTMARVDPARFWSVLLVFCEALVAALLKRSGVA